MRSVVVTGLLTAFRRGRPSSSNSASTVIATVLGSATRKNPPDGPIAE